MHYSAVIFDLDGTVLNNEEVYEKAFNSVLKRNGVGRGEKPQHVPGIGLAENWERIKKKQKIPAGVQVTKLVHETQDEYHRNLSSVKIRPGFFEFHKALKDEGVLIALATSNDWWLVEDVLEDLDLHKYFETLVTGDEVASRKPEPDIFLEVAKKLGVLPGECVAIEDSKAGVQAANEAGMKVVSVGGEHPGADLVAQDFKELNAKVLDSLFD